MSVEEILSIVKKFAINNSEKDDIHGFLHVERVHNLCLEIGKELGANRLVLEIASLLHDIGRIKKNQAINHKNHAELSAEVALRFLNSKNFQISQEELNNIIHSIRAHSFSNKVIPTTLEAKILSDADKLDALGAIGVYRTVGFTVKNQGGIDQVIEHLEKKNYEIKGFIVLRE